VKPEMIAFSACRRFEQAVHTWSGICEKAEKELVSSPF
jgi:hypothetical protein